MGEYLCKYEGCGKDFYSGENELAREIHHVWHELKMIRKTLQRKNKS